VRSESVVIVDTVGEESVVGRVVDSCVVSESCSKCVEMPRRRSTDRHGESLDSETSGSGSGAGTTSEPNVGSPTGWSDDPSALPMDVDDCPGAVGGTGLVPQASTRGDGAAAASAVLPCTRVQ